MIKRKTKSPVETQEFAAEFSAHLEPGDLVALVGDLGAGKTHFVQGLAAGFSVPEKIYVRSPSFALINEYPGGRLPLYHFDFYRLSDPSETDGLGIEEYFYGEGVTAVEWADHFRELIPPSAYWVEFKILGDKEREITITGKDDVIPTE